MGPGSFDPGNWGKARRAKVRAALQWGRGLLTPEIWDRIGPFFKRIWLQWGRGLLTPEMAADAAATAAWGSFNGAGVF